MENTSNYNCRLLVSLLEAHGIVDAVVSPGSRNAPMIVALSRSDKIRLTHVVDERSAAFIALGISSQSGNPVALVCTSGSALLDYAPAIAEAFYRRVPLIVISADRPVEWIDQDDSQTIWQSGALSNYVKNSCDLPVDDGTASCRWYVNRLINDVLLDARSGRSAPVHINLQISEPVGATGDYGEMTPRVIGMVCPRQDIEVGRIREMGLGLASPRRVMVVAGFMSPDQKLNKALNRLAQLPNFVVMTETISNLHGNCFISSIDSVLSVMDDRQRQEQRPDVVITLGGAIVSRFLKSYLRESESLEHWHVGISHTTVDCFCHLSLRIEMEPSTFFGQLASAMQPHRERSDYADRWLHLSDMAFSLHQSYVAKAGWSDLKAYSVVLPMIPKRWNVHFSNGTPIRYGQLFGRISYHRCDCNRGVSGIDGCTSTAIGSSMAYGSDVTLLISGDMSAQYDIGALACSSIPPRFKMIVVHNGGGGIFRFIRATSDLDITERYLAGGVSFPAQDLARGFGFSYFEARDETELRRIWADFCREDRRPALMVIHTPPQESARILKDYFLRHK